jgi:hypothetical protein
MLPMRDSIMTNHDPEAEAEEIHAAFEELFETTAALAGDGIEKANIIIAAVQIIRVLAAQNHVLLAEAVEALRG